MKTSIGEFILWTWFEEQNPRENLSKFICEFETIYKKWKDHECEKGSKGYEYLLN